MEIRANCYASYVKCFHRLVVWHKGGALFADDKEGAQVIC